MFKTQSFIDGKWVDAKDGGSIVVTSEPYTKNLEHGFHLEHGSPDPATAEMLGTVPEMGLAETKEAIGAAAKAFQSWGRTTAKVTGL